MSLSGGWGVGRDPGPVLGCGEGPESLCLCLRAGAWGGTQSLSGELGREEEPRACPSVWAQGMIALRRGATELTHEDYMEGILEVQAKKKANLQYYA